ncbi:hypothetical protein C5471_18555 [Photorhabdus tasmaniensis]|uniref:Uncharacterized protein n=1 Tax=Photorhabdus tasmaniensis TaxID=1004159 RepID=A0ABX0GMX2_9GAMM|nr:hypothetical protein [Photorhabdus tasmaniensis]
MHRRIILAKFYNLWHAIKARVCNNHDVDPNYFDVYSSDHQICCLKNRAAQIFILEAILHKHRQQHGTIFEPLEGEKALHHLIFLKTKWKPSEIRALSLEDSLLVIQDEMHLDNLPEEAQRVIDAINLPKAISFRSDDMLDEDWVPKENSIYLQTHV